MSAIAAQLLVDDQARLGECTLWCERRQALFWTDIEGCEIRAWNNANGTLERWPTPDRVGSFALCDDGRHLLLGLAKGLALFDLQHGTLASPLLPVEADNPGARINDGRCDREGRFVFGLFRASAEEGRCGNFYRVDRRMQLQRLDLPPAQIANSLAFSPDGRRLYFTDTPSRTIFVADYPVHGQPGSPRPWVQLPDSGGFPDGSTVDALGGLWNAEWGAGRVRRYDASGRETHCITVPASQVTCPAFGGPALDRLLISSARIGLDPATHAREPHAGAIWQAAAPVQGLPESRYRPA